MQQSVTYYHPMICSYNCLYLLWKGSLLEHIIIVYRVTITIQFTLLCHEEQVTKERSVSVASHCKDRSAQRPRMTKTTQLAPVQDVCRTL